MHANDLPVMGQALSPGAFARRFRQALSPANRIISQLQRERYHDTLVNF
jgi:hypothetical protein